MFQLFSWSVLLIELIPYLILVDTYFETAPTNLACFSSEKHLKDHPIVCHVERDCKSVLVARTESENNGRLIIKKSF